MKNRLDSKQQLVELMVFKLKMEDNTEIDVQPDDTTYLQRGENPLVIFSWRDAGHVRVEFDENGFCEVSYKILVTDNEAIARAIFKLCDAAESFFAPYIQLAAMYP